MITMARGIWTLRNPVWSFQIFSVINLTSSSIFPKRKNLYFKYNLQHKNIFPVLFFLGGKIGQGRIRILDFFKASNFPKNWKKSFALLMKVEIILILRYYNIASLFWNHFSRKGEIVWKPYLHRKNTWTFDMIHIDLEFTNAGTNYTQWVSSLHNFTPSYWIIGTIFPKKEKWLLKISFTSKKIEPLIQK